MSDDDRTLEELVRDEYYAFSTKFFKGRLAPFVEFDDSKFVTHMIKLKNADKTVRNKFDLYNSVARKAPNDVFQGLIPKPSGSLYARHLHRTIIGTHDGQPYTIAELCELFPTGAWGRQLYCIVTTEFKEEKHRVIVHFTPTRPLLTRPSCFLPEFLPANRIRYAFEDAALGSFSLVAKHAGKKLEAVTINQVFGLPDKKGRRTCISACYETTTLRSLPPAAPVAAVPKPPAAAAAAPPARSEPKPPGSSGGATLDGAAAKETPRPLQSFCVPRTFTTAMVPPVFIRNGHLWERRDQRTIDLTDLKIKKSTSKILVITNDSKPNPATIELELTFGPNNLFAVYRPQSIPRIIQIEPDFKITAHEAFVQAKLLAEGEYSGGFNIKEDGAATDLAVKMNVEGKPIKCFCIESPVQAVNDSGKKTYASTIDKRFEIVVCKGAKTSLFKGLRRDTLNIFVQWKGQGYQYAFTVAINLKQ